MALAIDAKKQERRDKLAAKAAALQEQLRKHDAAIRKARDESFNRLCYATGRAVMAEIEESPQFRATLTGVLDKRLKVAWEREQFGLKPMDDGKKAAPEKAVKKAKASDGEALAK